MEKHPKKEKRHEIKNHRMSYVSAENKTFSSFLVCVLHIFLFSWGNTGNTGYATTGTLVSKNCYDLMHWYTDLFWVLVVVANISICKQIFTNELIVISLHLLSVSRWICMMCFYGTLFCWNCMHNVNYPFVLTIVI